MKVFDPSMKVRVTHAGAASSVKGCVLMLHAIVSVDTMRRFSLEKVLAEDIATQAVEMACRQYQESLQHVDLLVHDWMLHDHTFTFFCDVGGSSKASLEPITAPSKEDSP